MGVEPVEPGRGAPRIVLLGRVREPQVDVRHRVGEFAFDHPDIQATAGKPAGDPFGPVLARDVEPVGEELHRAALGQQILRRAGQFRAHGVAGPAGVAVRMRRDARSGHERGVADDEIEAFAADGFGQVALAEIPVQTGQRGRRRGEAERARRQIGRRDPLRVRGQV